MTFRRQPRPTLREVLDRLDQQGHQLKELERMIIVKGEKIVTAQDDINAAVTAIQGVVTDLGAAVANIQAEIAALQAQGVDTSGLTDAVAQLQGVQASVDALETPAPPADGGDGGDQPAA